MDRVFGPDLRLLTGERLFGDGAVKVRCPLHNDTDKSLAIYPQSSYCYGACRQWFGYSETKDILGGTFDEDAPRYIPQAAESVIDVDDLKKMVDVYHERLFVMRKEGYLTGPKRGLDLDTIRRAKLGYNGFAYTIPIHTFDDSFQTIRFRRDPMEPGEPKYWGTKGLNAPMLYAPTRIHGRILWMEGEFDTLVAGQCGYSAVTMTNGIGAIPTQEVSTALWEIGVKRIDVVVDLDRASFGRAFKIADTLEEQAPFKVDVIRLPAKDLTEVYLTRGEPGVHAALEHVPFTIFVREGESMIVQR